jgi:hypothetical protein
VAEGLGVQTGEEVGVIARVGVDVGIFVGEGIGVLIGVAVAVEVDAWIVMTNCGAFAPDSRAERLRAVKPGVDIPKLNVPSWVT